MLPSSTLPMVSRAACSRSAPYVDSMGPSIVVAVGSLVGIADSLPSWLPGPATIWWIQVMRWLAAEPQGVLGLVSAQWWAEPASGMCGCGAGVSGSRVSLLVGKAMAQGVLGLMLAH